MLLSRHDLMLRLFRHWGKSGQPSSDFECEEGSHAKKNVAVLQFIFSEVFANDIFPGAQEPLAGPGWQ